MELHDPRVPVEPAGVEPVEGRGDRLRLHVGGRFDVLAVGGVDRPALGKLCGAAFEVGVAGDRRSVGADAVNPPHVERSQRKFHGDFQPRRMDVGFGDPFRRAASAGASGIARDLEIGRQGTGSPHLSRRKVGQALRHQVAAVPDEPAFDPGVADRQGVVLQTAVTALLREGGRAAEQHREQYRECVFHGRDSILPAGFCASCR